MLEFRRKISLLPILCCMLLLILFLLNGCGAKKPEEAAEMAPERELTPAEKRIAAWHALMREKRNAPEMDQLESVNSFFNRLEFVDDKILWGVEDYWATPQEMLAKNGGDCEDFVTAKYFTLRYLEVPEEKMRLTYVMSLNFDKPHMVLSYYGQRESEPLILDSLIDEILFASRRPDLIPVYSFNDDGLWVVRKQSSQRLRSADNLSLWQDLRQRFIREAIAAPLPE
jgi:predicted transglutaminase-like cysteine proteinase